jgi:hypothetical protein
MALNMPAAARAVLGEVVNSFPAPDEKPRALARSPEYLFVYCYTWGDNIWRLNPATGSVVSSFQSPLGVFTTGLSYSWGGNLWIGNWYNNYVYRCAESNGSIYGSWYAGHKPQGLAVEATGDGGFNPRAIFSSNTSPRRVWRHALTSGSIYSSFNPSEPIVDIAWDWRNKVVWGGYSSTIYGYRTTGAKVCSFPSPAAQPYGFTYYGQYLSVSTYENNYIWEIHCPPFDAVAPSSIGKIKTLYK